MFSTRSSYNHTLKTRWMATTILDHLLTYSKEKKSTKSNQSLNTGEEEEDTNITSNGKDTPFLRPHGNQNPHFWMMETCWNNTNSDINFDNMEDVKDHLTAQFSFLQENHYETHNQPTLYSDWTITSLDEKNT